MAATTLVRGGQVLRRRGREYSQERADIGIAGSTIREIAPALPTDGFDRVVDASGKLVMPGLVNAHTHSYANLSRGMFDGMPLETWFPFAWATTVRRTRREGYVSALVGCIEAIRTGTTTVLDHLGGSVESQQGALEAYADVGMRVVFAPMMADQSPLESARSGAGDAPAEWRELIDQARTLLQTGHQRDDRVSVLLGPSAPHRCSEQLLLACRDLAEEFDTGIHTHLLETRHQQSEAQALFGMPMVSYLVKLGLVTERFSAAHGVWCTGDDLTMLADHGATLVHNPWSNLALGSGIAAFPAWRRAGVRRALGTDGVNCGGSVNMLRAMSLASVLHRAADVPAKDWTSPSEILELATEGSARALRLDGTVGRLEPGYEADLVVVDLGAPTYTPPTNLVNQLVQGESGSGIVTVMVGGRALLDEGRLTGVDEREALEAARGMSAEILERNSDLLDSARKQSGAVGH